MIENSSIIDSMPGYVEWYC